MVSSLLLERRDRGSSLSSLSLSLSLFLMRSYKSLYLERSHMPVKSLGQRILKRMRASTPMINTIPAPAPTLKMREYVSACKVVCALTWVGLAFSSGGGVDWPEPMVADLEVAGGDVEEEDFTGVGVEVEPTEAVRFLNGDRKAL